MNSFSTHSLPARYALVAALLAIAAGCSSVNVPATGELGSENDVTRAVLPGLDQRVTISPVEPAVGDVVQIHSVITNGGSSAVALESRICGLDLGGTLELTMPADIGMCAGYSMGGVIAPGESRESSAFRRVSSRAGRYTLRVRHALRPELWVEIQVTVRAP